MATQTRRTTRRSARFFRATGKTSIVIACCGLVLWSAAAHAAVSLNGGPMNGMGLNGVALNGMPFNGLYVNGTPMQGMPFNGVPINGTPSMGCPSRAHPEWDAS